MSPRCWSSVPTKTLRLSIRPRIWPSLPDSAELSSREIVWTFSTPPPLSSSESAPRTSSTCAPTSVRSSGMTAPFVELALRRAHGGAARARRTSRRGGWSGAAGPSRSPAGETSPLTDIRDLGGPAVGGELDLADHADRDVVGAHARVRDEVDDVGEQRRDRVGVVPEDGAAGQRDVLHGLVAAPGEPDGGHQGHQEQAPDRPEAPGGADSCGAHHGPPHRVVSPCSRPWPGCVGAAWSRDRGGGCAPPSSRSGARSRRPRRPSGSR